ncbi:hypothetical protein [uncultured Bosea sp.]|uniref:hypothetical protein n=1 Tax=uncultured Bosea sp. TaxID=211457 RepID=UPI0025EA64E1|nr:hypothetical protein [uncultured Bosea sp.]
MERPLRIIASSLVLLCGLAAPAFAQDVPPSASFDDALCETGVVEHLTLDGAQRSHCRQLWQSRIEETRRRSKAHVARIIEENRLRRELEASLPPPPPPPVTVETFLGSDLAYGDVVVTHKGPRVFVGKAGEPARPEDFVALDSARSPHRGHAKSYDGAYPQPLRPQAATQPPTALKPQERKP